MPREVYRKALIEKYGEPAATEKDMYGDESQKLHWYQWHIGDGKVQCVPHIWRLLPAGPNWIIL